jgi:hypothetical protein
VDSFLKEKLNQIKERFPLFVENMGDTLEEMLANRRARVAKRQEKRNVRRQNRKKSVN